MLLLRGKLGSETDVTINATKNVTKSKLEYMLISNDSFL